MNSQAMDNAVFRLGFAGGQGGRAGKPAGHGEAEGACLRLDARVLEI